MMAAVLTAKSTCRSSRWTFRRSRPGDVLVRVRAALTCGTDVKVFRRGYHARMIVPPALFGHELAGDIVAVGEGCHGFRIGQRVVAANSAPCGECFYCRRGQENLCEDLLFNNGAYAEYIRIPAAHRANEHCTRFRTHVSYQDAALVEPLACVLRGLEESGLRAGRHRRGDRPGAHRHDVRAPGQGRVRRARDRHRTPPDRSWIAPARMGADEVDRRTTDGADVVERGRKPDRRAAAPMSSSKPWAMPEVWQLARRHAAARRRGELLRRLPERQPRSAWTPICCTIPKSPARPASITRRR